jgi:hypothetical protein
MSKKGAEFVANGVYTKHVLEKVKSTGKGSLSKLLACLFTALLASAITLADWLQAGPNPQETNAESYVGPRVNSSNVSSRSDFANGEGEILCPQNS